MICWHKWSKWKTFKEGFFRRVNDNIGGGDFPRKPENQYEIGTWELQRKECLKCGQSRMREVRRGI